ncbi:MAG: Na+/H+ antiporter NhaC family protein [Pseudomonadota bacterium]
MVLHDIPFELTITTPENLSAPDAQYTLRVTNEDREISLPDDRLVENLTVSNGLNHQIDLLNATGETVATTQIKALPGWFSLLPAILAIAFALIFRQVIAALFLGLWAGGTLLYGVTLSAPWFGLLDVVPVHVLGGLQDSINLAVVLFTLMIGGMVGIITKNGGTAGIVSMVVKFANTPQKGQAVTSGLGIAIFFDDYANTMIVGTTMRPVTDRLQISREKLAYLVDSTAATVATIALVTTWIGFVVALIGDSLMVMDGLERSAYSVFLNSIPFGFYQILALVFVFMIAFSGRDFGPMLVAERRARSEGLLSGTDSHPGETKAEADERLPNPDKPKRAMNAILPVAVLVIGTFIGLIITGRDGLEPGAALHEVIGNSDPFVAMMWASLIAVLVAGCLSIGQNILTLGETVDAWFVGARSMLLTVIILSMAWALADVNDLLGTGPYLTNLLGERVSVEILPCILFMIAAATAFATGSSWGVMGIIMPIALPLVWSLMVVNGLDQTDLHLIYLTVAAVIGGSVWGDHCSPISDTTILSSLASGCDHIDHVRTQIPYATLVGAFAVASSFFSPVLGLPWWVCIAISGLGLLAVLMLVGRRSDAHS